MLVLIVSLQQKAVMWFTNVSNYLKFPFFLKCPFMEALKTERKSLDHKCSSVRSHLQECLLTGMSTMMYRVCKGVQSGFCKGGH